MRRKSRKWNRVDCLGLLARLEEESRKQTTASVIEEKEEQVVKGKELLGKETKCCIWSILRRNFLESM